MSTTSNTKQNNLNKMRQRNFCITTFDLSKYEEWSKLKPDKSLKYMVFQQEECPKTKKKHIQGYIEFKNQLRTFKTIKTYLADNTLHIETRKGTATQARDYCMKSETQIKPPIEIGKFMTQGTRTDLTTVYTAIKNGKTPIQIMDEYPAVYIKYHKAINQVYNNIQSKSEGKYTPMETTVLYGDAGAGKTRYVYDTHGIENVYRLTQANDGSVWFDGYTGQDVLLLDDYYGWLKYSKFLQMIDNYRIRLNVKGTTTYSKWTKIYITSNKHPAEWYNTGLTPALSRRLKTIIQMKVPEHQVRKPIEKIMTLLPNGTYQTLIKTDKGKLLPPVLPATYESECSEDESQTIQTIQTNRKEYHPADLERAMKILIKKSEQKQNNVKLNTVNVEDFEARLMDMFNDSGAAF